MMRIVISWRVVTGSSVATSAAIVTKMKMPPTHSTIARTDCFVGLWPLIRALSRVVMTRAIAPSG